MSLRETGVGLAFVVVAHFVLPLAVIGLFASLLHFLMDVRSVWFGGGDSLKLAGTCFVAAVVLIVRYGRMQNASGRQSAYILLLVLVMVGVMPSLDAQGGLLVGTAWAWLGMPTLVVAVGITWWLAASLTRSLDLDLNRDSEESSRLYGGIALELAHMRFTEATGLVADVETPRKASAPPPPPGRLVRWARVVWEGLAGSGPAPADDRVVRVVSWMACPVLVLFAFAEPLMLNAPPELGRRAAVAMMIASLCAGSILAAASALRVHQQVRDADGRSAPGLIPLRVAVGAGLTAVALLAALGLPGVQLEGTGEELLPTLGVSDQTPLFESSDLDGSAGGGGEHEGEQSGGEPEPIDAVSASKELLSALAVIGKWVLVGLVVLAVVALLASARHWSAWARWLRSLVRQRPGRDRLSEGAWHPPDPLRGLASLSDLSDAEAVAEAYGRLMDLCERVGQERPPGTTPLEFSRRLPPALRPAGDPIRMLTRLYVRSAFTASGAGDGDGATAIAALRTAVAATVPQSMP